MLQAPAARWSPGWLPCCVSQAADASPPLPCRLKKLPAALLGCTCLEALSLLPPDTPTDGTRPKLQVTAATLRKLLNSNPRMR